MVFKGKRIKVMQAVDPELIIWHNYGINTYERILRSFAFWISAFLFLLFVFWTVTSLEKKNQDIAALTPQLKCPQNVTEAQAI